MFNHMFLSKTMKLFVVLIVFMVACDGINAEEDIDVVVAQDGSGNHVTISDAVLAAPSYSKTRYNIKIKAGVYQELVKVPEVKQNLAFIGDGVDVTIINGNRGTGFGMVDTANVVIAGDHFIAKYITFNNSAGCGDHGEEGPATALRTLATFSAFYKCKFNGYQDTLFVERGYQFFKNCDIYGTVDFIYGGAVVVFQSCNIYIHNRPGSETVITAQSKKEINEKSGFSIHQCNIKRAIDFVDKSCKKTFLGRPWSPLAIVVFMESFLDDIIDPQGWLPWPGQPNGPDAFYGEYENYGPGASVTNRVNWARPGNLNLEQAQQFTVRNFIMGDEWLPETEIPFELDLIHN